MKFDNNGLLPMIIQDANGGAVLTLFYANKESLQKTKETGYVWRFSRSAGKIMKKGETSGNFLKVISIKEDCDSDALLVRVVPSGPACHLGTASCFGQKNESSILSELVGVIKDRKTNPKNGSYTSELLKDCRMIQAKISEEAKEFIEAKKKSEIVWEAADLLFFTLVYLEKNSVELREVMAELARRSGKTKAERTDQR